MLQRSPLFRVLPSTRQGVQHSAVTARQSVLQQPALSTLSNDSPQRAPQRGQFRKALAVVIISSLAVEPEVALAMPVVVVPAASDPVLLLPVVEHHLNPP
jgi:hypothetical protein